jgi:localization factor PodJL
MTFGVPWNVKGIRPEARLTAKEAARRSGVSVGEWLDSVIIESAIEEGVRPRRPRQAHDEELDAVEQYQHRCPLAADDTALAGVTERLDGLSRQLERMLRDNVAPPPRTADRNGKDEENSQRLAHVIERFDRRLDHLFAQGGPESERRVAAVDRAVAALGASDAGPSGLDQAVAEISARQRALDADPTAPSGFDRYRPDGTALSQGLEQQLRNINSQIETLRRSGADEAIADLRTDLAEIRRTLTEAMPRGALTALENEIRALVDRLLASRQAGGDGAALAGIEEKIAEVRDAVRALAPAESLVGVDDAVQSLARKIEFIAANDQDPTTLHQLQEAIASLRGMTSQVASNEAMAELTQQVRGLSAKIDNLTTSGDVLATLEERISMLTDALQRHNGASMPPQFESVLKSVHEKLERLQTKSSDNAGLGAMEDRIGKLLERFDAGRHVNELAEPAAPAAPGIDAFKDEFAEIERNRLENDRRIQDSLEALNSTLGQVADRLSLIETDLRKGSPANATRPPEVATQPAPLERRSAPVPAHAPTQTAAALKLPPPPPKCAPIDPNLPPDHPLEPGSRGRVALSPGDRMAGSPAAKPPVIADPGGKSNFIAAARRAAQAATVGTAPGRSASSAPASADAAAGKHARSVLVGLGVVIILLGTLRVGANLFGWFDAASPESRTLTIETKPAAESDAPALPVPNRQSGLVPSGLPTFMTAPAAGVIVPDAAPVPRQAAASKPEYTGSVQLPVVPAATPEYAALPESPLLPTAIGGPALRAAAANGDAGAAYEVATRFAEGRGVPQNYQEAARWFERAVKEGLAPAQFRLGSLYEKGLGVKKDLQMARQLYVAAGEKGNAKAMHNLAVLYAEGIDGKPDYRTAAEWFRKAAARGIGDSQYNLGILYARGVGLEQNLAESYKWFALATLAGDKESAKKRDDVSARLDAESLMAARLAAQTWTAEPQPEEATSVKAPAGGWDQVAARPAKPKPPARPRVGSSAGSQ